MISVNRQPDGSVICPVCPSKIYEIRFYDFTPKTEILKDAAFCCDCGTEFIRLTPSVADESKKEARK